MNNRSVFVLFQHFSRGGLRLILEVGRIFRFNILSLLQYLWRSVPVVQNPWFVILFHLSNKKVLEKKRNVVKNLIFFNQEKFVKFLMKSFLIFKYILFNNNHEENLLCWYNDILLIDKTWAKICGNYKFSLAPESIIEF